MVNKEDNVDIMVSSLGNGWVVELLNDISTLKEIWENRSSVTYIK